MINVEHLSKEFRRPVRKEGAFGALRTLFSSEYNTVTAVDDISFTIGEGELVGYIGPNGAGKSTSIKMLTGIISPTSGRVEIGGISPHKERVRNARQIGTVFGQKTQLWWDVPVIESLKLLKDIYKVDDRTYKRNIEIFNDLLDLHQFQQTPARQLSLGQRMRADLAGALLHSPRILFLDEPTIGLDVVAKQKLRDFIQAINKSDKVTILLTTHDVGDIEKLCNRVMIIDKGHLIYDGDLDNIRTRFGGQRTLVVEFEQELGPVEAPGATLVRREGRKQWLQFSRETSPSVLIAHLSSRYPIVDLGVVEPAIEETIRTIYQGGTAGVAPAAAGR